MYITHKLCLQITVVAVHVSDVIVMSLPLSVMSVMSFPLVTVCSMLVNGVQKMFCMWTVFSCVVCVGLLSLLFRRITFVVDGYISEPLIVPLMILSILLSFVQLHPGSLFFYVLFFFVFECGVIIISIENYYRWQLKSEEGLTCTTYTVTSIGRLILRLFCWP